MRSGCKPLHGKQTRVPENILTDRNNYSWVVVLRRDVSWENFTGKCILR